MQHGPAASSGSNPKAPGSAGGYLLPSTAPLGRNSSTSRYRARSRAQDLLSHYSTNTLIPFSIQDWP